MNYKLKYDLSREGGVHNSHVTHRSHLCHLTTVRAAD